jgi:hypothetical protein
VVLIVKAISTETAEVIAAGRARFPKSSEFQQLLQTAIVDGQSAVTTPSIYKDAAKDRLRIALTNVTPLRGKTPEGKDLIIGVVCSFDLTNRDLKQTLKVAHNSEAIVNEPLFIHRSKLTDSAGHVWRLAETAGLPLVSCGVKGDPGSIIQLIKTGEFTTQQALRQYTNRGFENTTGWGGDFLVIPPGATKRISLTFKDIADDGRATRHGTNTFEKFQLDTELVIGAFEEGRKDVDYCLEGIVLDRIPLPQGEK